MVKGSSSDPLKRLYGQAQQIVGHEPRERVSHEALLKDRLYVRRAMGRVLRESLLGRFLLPSLVRAKLRTRILKQSVFSAA